MIRGLIADEQRERESGCVPRTWQRSERVASRKALPLLYSDEFGDGYSQPRGQSNQTERQVSSICACWQRGNLVGTIEPLTTSGTHPVLFQRQAISATGANERPAGGFLKNQVLHVFFFCSEPGTTDNVNSRKTQGNTGKTAVSGHGG
jgi:hypothetical protein